MARGSHICAAALALTAAAAAAVTSCAAQAVPVWWPPHPVSLLQLQAGAAAVPATYAYYGGNYLPSAPWHPNNRGTAGSHNNDPYWQRSPYWQYFRQVWGDAPFTDANFRLWMGGFFQGFDRPRKAMVRFAVACQCASRLTAACRCSRARSRRRCLLGCTTTARTMTPSATPQCVLARRWDGGQR